MFRTLLVITLLVFTFQVYSEDEFEGKGKRELTEEELESKIGRFGEEEEIPEGFKYSDLEEKLWRSNHLENIDKPMRLLYEFEKSGSYEEGFTDSVFFDVLEINEDGSKNTNLEFFTADRKQAVSPGNVLNITGNPVLGIYMQGDIYEMDRYTGGSWRYFQKALKVAFRDGATITPLEFEFAGKNYTGEKYVIQPYLDDPRRRQFEEFANKQYEFIFCDSIPGELYQIRTFVPAENETDEPLVEEVLTLLEITAD